MEMKVFSTANGLPTNQFNYRSGFKDEAGNIYLGSINGFVAFDPRTFAENRQVPAVAITDFLLFNKEVPVGETDSPLKSSITFSDKVVLTADQNSFSFRIAALSYQAPRMNKLMYKLEGFDEGWLTIGESPLVTYSNLGYGDYVFKVKASNSDGVWNEQETSLHLSILPPFYLSGWAYCFYVLFSWGVWSVSSSTLKDGIIGSNIAKWKCLNKRKNGKSIMLRLISLPTLLTKYELR